MALSPRWRPVDSAVTSPGAEVVMRPVIRPVTKAGAAAAAEAAAEAVARPALSRSRRAGFAVLAFLLGLCALLPQLGAAPLGDPSEARYAEAAREMYESGDWLTPRVNGLIHFTKPPLTYWLGAASFKLLGGPSEFAVRLPVALAGAGLCALSALIAMELLGAAGFWAALFLSGSPAFLIMGRLFLTDMFLALAVVIFYGPLLRAAHRNTPLDFGGRLWIMGAAAAGFLAKGPVFFLWTLLPLAIFAWAAPRCRPLVRAASGWPFVLGLVLTLPWFLACMAIHQGLWKYFLFNQSVKALVSSKEFHPGTPLVFYLPSLLLIALPFLPALWKALRGFYARKEALPAPILLGCWIAPPLLLLSLIPAKHETYILPLAAPLAIFAALGLARLGATMRRACLALPVIFIILFQLFQFMLFAESAAGLRGAQSLRARFAAKNLKPGVERVARIAGKTGTVALVENYSPSFFFYLSRPVLLVNPTIAGRFVNDEPAPQLLPELDAGLEKVWADEASPVLVFYKYQFMAFAARHPEAMIAGEDDRFVILIPRPGTPRKVWRGHIQWAARESVQKLSAGPSSETRLESVAIGADRVTEPGR